MVKGLLSIAGQPPQRGWPPPRNTGKTVCRSHRLNRVVSGPNQGEQSYKAHCPRRWPQLLSADRIAHRRRGPRPGLEMPKRFADFESKQSDPRPVAETTPAGGANTPPERHRARELPLTPGRCIDRQYPLLPPRLGTCSGRHLDAAGPPRSHCAAIALAMVPQTTSRNRGS
jgi:hypothetical protein